MKNMKDIEEKMPTLQGMKCNNNKKVVSTVFLMHLVLSLSHMIGTDTWRIGIFIACQCIQKEGAMKCGEKFAQMIRIKTSAPQ